MTEFHTDFSVALSKHFGSEVQKEILDALKGSPSVSLRMHPFKTPTLPWPSAKVPWCEHGHLLNDRPSFAQDPLFHGGAYYVQESSSMILNEVIKSLALDQEPVNAIDLCAAPGGKSTLLIDALHTSSTIVCNEVDGKRNAILRENLLKWGAANTIVTKSTVNKLSDVGSQFDLVVLDAPCSGEGMFRKDAFAVNQWNIGLVNQCAKIQEELISQAFKMLKPGGHLIYSTCTLNATENEANIERALTNGFSLALPQITNGAERLLAAENGIATLGYYLLPGRSTGEGLFFSVLKKTSNEEFETAKLGSNSTFLKPEQLIPDFDFDQSQFASYLEHQGIVKAFDGSHSMLELLASNAFITQVGLPVLERKGKGMIPHHGLAMSPSTKAAIDMELAEALEFLRKSKSPPSEGSKGWKAVSYEGITLGWIKDLQNRTNNYYPSSLRLRQ